MKGARLPLIEVCVEGIDGLLVAQANGADRIELCAGLSEGGLTPSLGVVRGALAVARVPVYVIVRPRGGDFLYTEAEHASMLEDVRLLRESGVPGVVLGCLTGAGQVDLGRLRALVAQAGPMSVTFHRAFDMTADPFRALEDLIDCGVERVLTSGQQPTALLGRERLCDLLRLAGDRIAILGGGGIRAENVAQLLDTAPLDEIHFAAMKEVASPMQSRNLGVQMGQAGGEYRRRETDGEVVAATTAAARSARARAASS